MSTIGITGGTGLIGTHISKLLLSKGYDVIIFTRGGNKVNEKLQYAHWDPSKNECDIESVKKLDAVINLAGAGIADKRWTAKRKKEIEDSRVQGTTFLISTLKEHARSCNIFIGASAIGFYGTDSIPPVAFTENSPHAEDFLGNTCMQWEEAEIQASTFLRTVIFRFGIVLSKEGGAYTKFAHPQSFGIVPILGNGKQIISWIHIYDLCNMLLFAMENSPINGIFNAVAPKPVSNKELMKMIAKEKGGIKILLPVPSFVLKIMLGEMSEEVLKSTTINAGKIINAGFSFKFNTIPDAVKDLETQ